MEVILAAMLGAVLAGGIEQIVKLYDRRISRQVAARMVIGDLYVFGRAFEIPLEKQRWPDWDHLGGPMETWKENRQPWR